MDCLRMLFYENTSQPYGGFTEKQSAFTEKSIKFA